MKINSIGNRGFAPQFLVLVFVVAFAIAGVAYLVASHADSVSTGTQTNSVVLWPVRGGPSTVPFNYVGTQNVEELLSGEQMVFSRTVKGNVTACYLVYVQQPKTGTANLNVIFASNNNMVQKKLSSNLTNNFQEVCVPPGNLVNPGYSIKNVSPSSQNVPLEVYEEIISW